MCRQWPIPQVGPRPFILHSTPFARAQPFAFADAFAIVRDITREGCEFIPLFGDKTLQHFAFVIYGPP